MCTPTEIATYRQNLQRRQAEKFQARETHRLRAKAEVEQAVRQTLPDFPTVERVYLFGSALWPGGMRDDSDVDVALEGPIDAETYFAVWKALDEAVRGVEIDLLRLQPDERITKEVHRTGLVIYERRNGDAQGAD